jgi:hypothetical protein
METLPEDLVITATSSNPSLISETNIVFSGAGTNLVMSLRPTTNETGSATITVSLTDTNGATVNDSFVLTVEAVNDLPTLDTLSNLSIDEDAGPQSVPLFGISSGASNETQTLTLTAISSDPSIIPNPETAYTTGDSSGTLNFTSLANTYGPVTLTVTVDDGASSNNIVTRSFTVTVISSNDLPRIQDIPDATTLEDTLIGPIHFTIEDIETSATNLSVIATSSDTNLVPIVNIALDGEGTNRTLNILPATNQSGVVTITLTTTDGDGGTASDSFTFTVTAVNDPPTLDVIADLSVGEDSGNYVVGLDGIGSGATNEDQILTVTAVSSDPAVIPPVTIGYTNPATAGILTFTPALNATGSVIITVTVDDGGETNNLFSRSFTVTVMPTNDLPALSVIADQTTDEGTPLIVGFMVADVETPSGALNITATSSNPTLLPDGSIVTGGGDGNRTLLITPATNQHGSAIITVTVTDANSGEASESFLLTVRQRPTITTQPQSQTATNGATVVFTVEATGTVPLSYQWKRDGADVSGQTNSILTLSAVQPSDAGNYFVLVSNAAGSTTSGVATLRVLTAPTITAISHSGATAGISFTTGADLNYSVEYKDSVDAPNWSALSPVVGTGSVMTVLDPAASGPSRIYRVRVE